MNLFYFLSYRLSTIFLILYVLYFSTLRFPFVKSIVICAAAYVATLAVDYLGSFRLTGGLWYIPVSILNILFLSVMSCILDRKRNSHSIFTVFCAIDYTLPGNDICYAVYKFTEDLFSSLLAEGTFDFLVLVLITKMISSNYRKVDDDVGGWGYLAVIPAVFYVAMTSLTVWPMNVMEVPQAAPGIIFLYVLMFLAFVTSVNFFFSRKKKQTKDMNLVFLAEYSDRIKQESAKVNSIFARIEEMGCVMQTVSHEINDLLNLRKYDDIRTISATLESEAARLNQKKNCTNSSINSVTMEVENNAGRLGVNVNYKLNVPESLGPAEFEYAVVVERILQASLSGCLKLETKEMFVSMYSSGAWLNLEIKVRLADSVNEPDTPKLHKTIMKQVEKLFAVPEIDAFIQKYEVQRNVRFNMGMMISEFNVRIN